MTTQDETRPEAEVAPLPDEFVGYGPAAAYVGLKRNTLSSYVTRGIGPVPQAQARAVGQYNVPVFARSELDRWMAGRPGQGARTDLVSAGG